MTHFGHPSKVEMVKRANMPLRMLSKFSSELVHSLVWTSISWSAPSWYFIYQPLSHKLGGKDRQTRYGAIVKFLMKSNQGQGPWFSENWENWHFEKLKAENHVPGALWVMDFLSSSCFFQCFEHSGFFYNYSFRSWKTFLQITSAPDLSP